MRYNTTVRTRLPALLLSLLAVFTASTAHAYAKHQIPHSWNNHVGAFTAVTPQNRIGGSQLASLLATANLELQLGGSTEAIWLSTTANASGSGLFLQRDPEGYADSVNLYAGMRWDPVNLRDPTGRLNAVGTDTYGIPSQHQAGISRAQQEPIDCSTLPSGLAFTCAFTKRLGSTVLGSLKSAPTVIGAIVGWPSSVDEMNRLTDPKTGPIPRAIGETLLINERVIKNPELLEDALIRTPPGKTAEIIGEAAADTFVVVAPLAKGPPPSGPKPRLNLGSGRNPMPDAVNIDVQPGPGVNVVADANSLPFEAGAFGEAHAINPYGFQPVSCETARVLESGSLLRVTGTARNPWAQASAAEAEAAGFEFVAETEMCMEHRFGVQKTSSGGELNTRTSKTRTYRRK